MNQPPPIIFNARPQRVGDYTDVSYQNYGYIPIQARPHNDGNRNNIDAFSIIHPLFGLMYVNATGRVEERPEDIENQYNDFAMREVGLAEEINKNNRVLFGLANPRDYLNNKNLDLARIGRVIGENYRANYTNYINQGMSYEDAKRDALKDARSLKETMMRKHDNDWPDSIVKKSLDNLHR